MERKLASIQKIQWIKPIENADKIELAGILGWQVVVRKNEFNINDLIVYFEIDSILPEKSIFEFMRDRKFRVKTIKLRKVLSQGLIISIKDILPKNKYIEGQDVTDIIGVKKYDPEPEINYQKINKVKMPFYLKPFKRLIATNNFFRKHFGYLIGIKKTFNFPKFIRKTDEPRLQSNPEFLDFLTPDRNFFITQKIDGTSGTFYYNNGLYGICSRNLEIFNNKCPRFFQENIYKIISDKYKIEEKLNELKKNIAIQGEIVGEGIQANKLKLTGLDLFVFNIYDIDKSNYYNFEDFINFCKELGLKTVPILNPKKQFLQKPTIEELLERAKGNYESGNPQEGIVIRPIKEELLHTLGRFSFKVINNDFLLKYGQ